ncbi:glycosyltransferase, partial [Burkholderia gladioli]
KRMDLIVAAFAGMPERRLIVIGDGPDMDKVRARAGPNVTILGHQPFAVLKDHLQRARAFVFAAEEDFGISVVEAQACGTPVIAFGKGGACETVIDETQPHPTGLFFATQTVEAIQEAVARFEANLGRFSPVSCRLNAKRFSKAEFRRGLLTAIVDATEGREQVGAIRAIRTALAQLLRADQEADLQADAQAAPAALKIG